jgi:hypothetical protein
VAACYTTTYSTLKPACSIHVREIFDSVIQIKEHFHSWSGPIQPHGGECVRHEPRIHSIASVVPITSYASWNNLLSTMSPTPSHGWIWFPSKARQFRLLL